LELRLRRRVEEDGVVVVRDREPLRLELAREETRVGAGQPGQETARTLLAELDPQAPVVVRHAGTVPPPVRDALEPRAWSGRRCSSASGRGSQTARRGWIRSSSYASA